MKQATVVIPHAFTSRWTAIAVASLKAHTNAADFDIIVVDCSKGHPSIKTITETSLGEGVLVIDMPDPNLAGHQIALDHCIDLVETPWFVAWETDVRVMRDGWLDWMLSYVKDEYIPIVGWYWKSDPEFDDLRHYISPAGALYKTSILKRLKKEVLLNTDLAVCYGPDMSKRIDIMKEYPDTGGKLIPRGIWGPFLEARGFGNVYPYSKQRAHWVPEPGNWIYNRCVMQWECINLPGAMVEGDPSVVSLGLPHTHTYVGPSDAEAYYVHYWAGTVSHNFDKHMIGPAEEQKLAWWLTREFRIWNEQVPEDARRYCIDNGLVRTYDEELAYGRSRVKR